MPELIPGGQVEIIATGTVGPPGPAGAPSTPAEWASIGGWYGGSAFGALSVGATGTGVSVSTLHAGLDADNTTETTGIVGSLGRQRATQSNVDNTAGFFSFRRAFVPKYPTNKWAGSKLSILFGFDGTIAAPNWNDSSTRIFFGVANSTTAGNVVSSGDDPDTALAAAENWSVGIGKGAGDTFFQFYCFDGEDVMTKVASTIAIPANGAPASFLVEIDSTTNNLEATVTLTNLETNVSSSHTFTGLAARSLLFIMYMNSGQEFVFDVPSVLTRWLPTV